MDNPPPEEKKQCVIPIHKPKLREYIFFFASGIIVSIPFAVFYEGLFPTAVSAVVLIVIGAPFIEELAKVFPLFYRHGETERSLVSIGLLIGLGFGIAELVQYVALQGVPVFVRIPGVIFHASSAIITAYGVAKKKPLLYYLIAVLLHAANNYLAVTADFFSLAAELLILIVTYLLAWRFWHQASKDKIVV
jgi:RsiW-degrading membrane proteinase PrsW (M82 family)